MIQLESRERLPESLQFYAQRVLSLLSIYPPTGTQSGKISSMRDATYLSIVANGIHLRYLYYQMFGIDACFRFKRRQVSSYEKDPELGPGYAYLVAWDSYREYLRRFTDQEEVCHSNPALELR
jgi:hypothetical protein